MLTNLQDDAFWQEQKEKGEAGAQAYLEQYQNGLHVEEAQKIVDEAIIEISNTFVPAGAIKNHQLIIKLGNVSWLAQNLNLDIR